MKKTLPWIGFVLTICWMGVIFYFSSRTSGEIDVEKGFIMDICKALYGNDRLNSLPDNEKNRVLSNMSFIISKCAHYLEYGVLSLFIFIACINFKKYNIRFIVCMIISILYAISDEYHQSFTSGRYPRLLDVIYDSMGALTMVLMIVLILNICNIIRIGKKND